MKDIEVISRLPGSPYFFSRRMGLWKTLVSSHGGAWWASTQVCSNNEVGCQETEDCATGLYCNTGQAQVHLALVWWWTSPRPSSPGVRTWTSAIPTTATSSTASTTVGTKRPAATRWHSKSGLKHCTVRTPLYWTLFLWKKIYIFLNIFHKNFLSLVILCI